MIHPPRPDAAVSSPPARCRVATHPPAPTPPAGGRSATFGHPPRVPPNRAPRRCRQAARPPSRRARVLLQPWPAPTLRRAMHCLRPAARARRGARTPKPPAPLRQTDHHATGQCQPLVPVPARATRRRAVGRAPPHARYPDALVQVRRASQRPSAAAGHPHEWPPTKAAPSSSAASDVLVEREATELDRRWRARKRRARESPEPVSRLRSRRARRPMGSHQGRECRDRARRIGGGGDCRADEQCVGAGVCAGRTASSGCAIPLSATAMQCAGMSRMSVGAVAGSMTSVSRLRLLTPMTGAPMARARRSSVASRTSTSASSPASVASRNSAAKTSGASARAINSTAEAPRTRASHTCTGCTMKSLRIAGMRTAAATASRSSSDPPNAIRFREHGDRGRAPALVGERLGGRVESGRDRAFGGRGALDLGDDRERVAAERGGEGRRRGPIGGGGAERVEGGRSGR